MLCLERVNIEKVLINVDLKISREWSAYHSQATCRTAKSWALMFLKKSLIYLAYGRFFSEADAQSSSWLSAALLLIALKTRRLNRSSQWIKWPTRHSLKYHRYWWRPQLEWGGKIRTLMLVTYDDGLVTGLNQTSVRRVALRRLNHKVWIKPVPTRTPCSWLH